MGQAIPVADLKHFDPSRYSSNNRETLRKSYHLAFHEVWIHENSIGTGVIR